MVYLLKTFTSYVDFNGRARRAEYWQWTLLMLTVNFTCSGLLRVVPDMYIAPLNWGNWIWTACTLIPGIAVTVRRFHDTNRSGWWALYLMISPVLITYLSIGLYFITARYTPGHENSGAETDSIWFVAGSIIGLICYVPPLIFLLQDGDARSNRYGADPKRPNMADLVF